MGTTAHSRKSREQAFGGGVIYIKGRNPNDMSPEELERNRQARLLLQQWREEADAMTDEQREQAERDWQVFRKAMNESRRGYRIPYPD